MILLPPLCPRCRSCWADKTAWKGRPTTRKSKTDKVLALEIQAPADARAGAVPEETHDAAAPCSVQVLNRFVQPLLATPPAFGRERIVDIWWPAFLFESRQDPHLIDRRLFEVLYQNVAQPEFPALGIPTRTISWPHRFQRVCRVRFLAGAI